MQPNQPADQDGRTVWLSVREGETREQAQAKPEQGTKLAADELRPEDDDG